MTGNYEDSENINATLVMWYKRNIDVRYMQNLWGDRVSWDTADNLYAGYTVVSAYKEVKGK